MYSTKTASITGTVFESNYMPVGINENVYLKEVSVEKSPTGLDFLRFTFANEQDQTVEMTEWKNTKNMWIKTDEDLQRRDDAQFGRILQIMECYFDEVPEAEFVSFTEMINWVKTTLAAIPNKNNVKLRLKVVYDKKGYTKVSGLGIFIEPMGIKETQIKLFKGDLIERPIQADKEPNNDPLASGITESTPENSENDDLPF